MEGRALAGIGVESGWGATEMASVTADSTDGVQEALTFTM